MHGNPIPNVDPDDPAFKGKLWCEIESTLQKRDAYMLACGGRDFGEDRPEVAGKGHPGRPLYAIFPWEEIIEPFARKQGCTQANWSHSCLRYTLGQQSATLTLAKGAGNNTIDKAMLDALQDAVLDLQGRKDVRVVIVKAEGKLFCNGFDPKYLMSESALAEKDIIAVQMQFAKILYHLQKLPQFVIALLQGSAMGAGVGLVCACDLVVAVKGAFFAMSEARLGLVPATSIPYIMRRIPFGARARQLLLASASVSAEQGREYGIVNEVVEDEAALGVKAADVCKSMTACAPGAVAVTKEIIQMTLGQPPSSFMTSYVAKKVNEVRKSEEALEGIQAIKSKKRPAWMAQPITP